MINENYLKKIEIFKNVKKIEDIKNISSKNNIKINNKNKEDNPIKIISQNNNNNISLSISSITWECFPFFSFKSFDKDKIFLYIFDVIL